MTVFREKVATTTFISLERSYKVLVPLRKSYKKLVLVKGAETAVLARAGQVLGSVLAIDIIDRSRVWSWRFYKDLWNG